MRVDRGRATLLLPSVPVGAWAQGGSESCILGGAQGSGLSICGSVSWMGYLRRDSDLLNASNPGKCITEEGQTRRNFCKTSSLFGREGNPLRFAIFSGLEMEIAFSTILTAFSLSDGLMIWILRWKKRTAPHKVSAFLKKDKDSLLFMCKMNKSQVHHLPSPTCLI